MAQDFKINKKRVERLGLTCSLMDDDGKVHYFQDGHEYVEIGGVKWAICNVGAEKETDRGLYFQWGDIQGYTADQVGRGEKCFRWDDYKYGNGEIFQRTTDMTKYNSSDGKTILEPLDDTARFHMGGGWRMPTEKDFRTLLANTTNQWVTDYRGSGVSGRLFISEADNSKTLFFPCCGHCSGGVVYNVGSCGYYWNSSLNSSTVIYGGSLALGAWNYYITSNSRYFGFFVRGVCH